MRISLNEYSAAWLNRRVPPAAMVKLAYRNIFILPTRSGMGLLLVALLVFLAAANYGLSIGFTLSFLMVSVFIVNLLHTYRNLAGIAVHGTAGSAVFAGEKARFSVRLIPLDDRCHEAVRVGFKDQAHAQLMNLDAPRTITLSVVSIQRGYQPMPRMRIDTVFPLGLCRAWSHPALTMRCLVYPAPCPPPDRSVGGTTFGEGHYTLAQADEEFRGLRDYRPGDPINRIAWKSLPGTRQLQVKDYAAAAADSTVLDWHSFPGVAHETRLSYLCHLVLEHERNHIRYSVRLPHWQSVTGIGTEHCNSVLEKLALCDL